MNFAQLIMTYANSAIESISSIILAKKRGKVNDGELKL